MQEIPLMRTGLLLMAATAAVGGLAMLVADPNRNNGRDGGAAADTLADTAAAAAPAGRSTTPAGFACRVDTSGVALPDAVHESSGLALSGGADALWTHNDSGDPVLHLVGMDGAVRGRVRVAGASVTDWEDVAGGPCPGRGRCLYVGDVGDNTAERARITIYRVPEPAPADAQTLRADALLAEYPDGAHDAEAMFVLPDGGVYVVTKGETGPIALYRLPRTARPGASTRLERVAELRRGSVPRSERVTGAAASPDGRWFVLRTLNALHFYRAGELAGGRLGQPLTYDLKPLNEAQGEAVDVGAGGAIYLSSEGGRRENPATLSRLTCTLPAG